MSSGSGWHECPVCRADVETGRQGKRELCCKCEDLRDEFAKAALPFMLNRHSLETAGQMAYAAADFTLRARHPNPPRKAKAAAK